VSAEPPSAPEDPSPPRPPDEQQPPFDPSAFPPPYYPPPPGYPPPGYPPPGYPPPGYPPPGYPPPNGQGYPPPPGYPYGPPGQAQDQGPGGPRQHGFRTPYAAQPPPGGGGPPRTARPGGQRSVIWLIVVVAIVAILVRSHHLSSTEIIVFCVLIPSVMLHEVAHGVVALWCGDDTAKRAGRITLNPIRHVTALGTIIVPIITVLAGIGWFGWAKPVPVNVSRLRSPRNQGVLVALAGPFTNIVLAAMFGAVFYFAFGLHAHTPVYTPFSRLGTLHSTGARIIFYAGFINLWVACFNLIPVPPLDGSAVIERLLPASWWPGYLRIRPYGMFVIIGALVLMSFAHTSPIQRVVTDLVTWWAHLVRAI
jgi:Zn-dependent protease